jgi:hypothetical protein
MSCWKAIDSSILIPQPSSFFHWIPLVIVIVFVKKPISDLLKSSECSTTLLLRVWSLGHNFSTNWELIKNAVSGTDPGHLNQNLILIRYLGEY